MRECDVCGKLIGKSLFKNYCSYKCAGKMTKNSLGFRERNYPLEEKVDFDARVAEGFKRLSDDERVDENEKN